MSVPVTPLDALMAYMNYMKFKGAKSTIKKIPDIIVNEAAQEKIAAEHRQNIAKKQHEEYEMYNTGTYEGGIKEVALASAGKVFNATQDIYKRSMKNMSIFYGLGMGASALGWAGNKAGQILGSVGAGNPTMQLAAQGLVNVGTGLNSAASTLSTVGSLYNNLAMLNLTYFIQRKLMDAAFGALGNMGLGPLAMFAAPMVSMAMMPVISKINNAISKFIGNRQIKKIGGLSINKLPITYKFADAEDFVSDQPLHQVNHLINMYQENISPEDQLSIIYLAQIASYTSSIPVIAAHLINKEIKQTGAIGESYNKLSEPLQQYNKGLIRESILEKHASRIGHGEFMHTFGENLGLAATEFTSFLQKISYMTDIIGQIGTVLSGGNIMDEMRKFNKLKDDTEARKSVIYAKTLGLGPDKQLISAYYTIQQSAQDLIQHSKTYEQASLSLLAGIYEATRMAALELATIRTKGFAIKEPIRYNVVGAEFEEKEKGIIGFLKNKIPMFGAFMEASGAILNMAKFGVELLPEGKFKKMFQSVFGIHKVKRYHDEKYNRLATGFNYQTETTILERIGDKIGEKFNEKILKIPLIGKILGNENRQSLKEKKEIEFYEEIKKERELLMKEIGMVKLEDQPLFYRYMTREFPGYMDLMIYHLAAIHTFTKAIMKNTAEIALSAGRPSTVAEIPEFKKRALDIYTGRMMTEKEFLERDKSINKKLAAKARENARESERTIYRFLNAFIGKAVENAEDIQKPEAKGFFGKLLNNIKSAPAEATQDFKKTFEQYDEYIRNTAKKEAELMSSTSWNYQQETAFEYGSAKIMGPAETFLESLAPEITKKTEEAPKLLKVDVAEISAQKFFKLYDAIKQATEQPKIIDTKIVESSESKPTVTASASVPVISLQPTTLTDTKAFEITRNKLLLHPLMLGIPSTMRTQVETEKVIYEKALKNFTSFIKETVAAAAVASIMSISTAAAPNEFLKQITTTPFAYLIKNKDNTLEDIKEAKDLLLNKNDPVNRIVSSIEKTNKILSDIKNQINQITSVGKKETQITSETGDLLNGLTDLLNSGKDVRKILSKVGKSVLRTGGRALSSIGSWATRGLGAIAGSISAPVAATIAGVTAAAGAGAYGAWHWRNTEAKNIINRLQNAGLAEYNFFGKSVIKDEAWPLIAKMSVSEISQLVQFDDWDDITKKRLEEILYQKTLSKKAVTENLKYEFKDIKEAVKYLDKHSEKHKEKVGWLADTTHFVGHKINPFSAFRRGLMDVASRGKYEILEKLDAAGAIDLSDTPFTKTDILDWSTVIRLPLETKEILLKLGNLNKDDFNKLKQLILKEKSIKTKKSEIQKTETQKTESSSTFEHKSIISTISSWLGFGDKKETQKTETQKPVTQQAVIQKPEIQKTETQKSESSSTFEYKSIISTVSSWLGFGDKKDSQKPETQKSETQTPVAQQAVIQKPETQQAVIQKPEIQKTETQKSETQTPVAQQAVIQKSEIQKTETQKSETQTPVAQQAVIQKSEIQKTETQKSETQTPVAQQAVIQKSEIQKTETQKSESSSTFEYKSIISTISSWLGFGDKKETQKTETQKPVTQQAVIQKPETQKTETQKSETQTPVAQQAVIQKSEIQKTKTQTPVAQQAVIQKPEIQKTETQKSESTNTFEHKSIISTVSSWLGFGDKKETQKSETQTPVIQQKTITEKPEAIVNKNEVIQKAEKEITQTQPPENTTDQIIESIKILAQKLDNIVLAQIESTKAIVQATLQAASETPENIKKPHTE